MKRLKTFLIYALIIAAFWLFSNILIYIAINGTYAHINTKVYTTSPEIIVGDSKATYLNGFVKGGIKNNTKRLRVWRKPFLCEISLIYGEWYAILLMAMLNQDRK